MEIPKKTDIITTKTHAENIVLNKLISSTQMDIQYIKNLLNSWFSFPKNKIYCSVSTVTNKTPHIRTMDLYDITENGALIFLTDTSTRKWMDLQQCQNIAVCILHVDHGQIIVEGIAKLKTSTSDFSTISIYWNQFLDQYWRNFYLSRASSQTKEIPVSFGLITIIPYLWEVLEINNEAFLKSSRKQFKLIDGEWVIHNLLPV